MNIHVEIFIASRILGQNRATFTPLEIRKYIEEEFNDTQEGIKTQTTSMCVANARLNFNCWFQLSLANKTWSLSVIQTRFRSPLCRSRKRSHSTKKRRCNRKISLPS